MSSEKVKKINTNKTISFEEIISNIDALKLKEEFV